MDLFIWGPIWQYFILGRDSYYTYDPLRRRSFRGEFQPVETALNAAQGGIMGCEHHPDAEVQQFFLVCAFSLPQKTPASPEKCPEFSHQNRWKNVDLHPSYAI